MNGVRWGTRLDGRAGSDADR